MNEKKAVITVEHISKRFFKPAPLDAFDFELPADTMQKEGRNGEQSRGEKNAAQPAERYINVLNDVSFTLYEGECLLIGGANGSGKSILMSIIADLEEASAGRISVNGRCGLIFQDADMQILGETPAEDIMFGLKNLKLKNDEARTRCKNALEKTGLLKRASFPARFLSGGEKRRLAVAGILAMDCPIVIFDEPYANLDYSGVVQVNELIRMLKKDGRTVLILTHELEKCYALADRFIVLCAGEKVFDGTPDEGLKLDLKQWNIRHPLCSYTKREDLLWT